MGESRPERRRDVRYAVRLPAMLLRGKRTTEVFTNDVCYHGLFLRTDATMSLRQLLKIEIALPPDDVKVVLHGMVARIVAPGASGAQPPGLGVELVGLAGDAQAKWNAFVAHLAGRRRESIEKMQVARPAAPDPVRRRYERADAALRLRIPTVEQLSELVTTNISHGGLFFRTTLALSVGDELPITVVHPVTSATFDLVCVVRRLARAGEAPGVGVEFVGMDSARRAAFEAFVADVPDLVASDEDVDESQIAEWEEEEPTNKRARP